MKPHDIVYISKYAHFFSKKAVTACYHSLRMKPVFIPTQFIHLFKEFGNRIQISDLIGKANNPDGLIDAIDALIEAKILVDGPEQDAYSIQYFRGMTGNPYPHLAYFLLTDRCNFRCTYCFVKNQAASGYKEESMTKEIALRGLDFFCSLICKDQQQFEMEKTIVFYGGEPLANWNVLDALLDCIRHYKNNGMLPNKTILNMVTNGTLITEKIAKKLKENDVQVSISIDGDRSVTNSCRAYANGKPVYDDIKKGFDICRKQEMDIGLSCTLTNPSISNFDSTMRVILDECSVKNLGFNLMITDDENIALDYNNKAARFVIDAFKIFRAKGVYEDRMMRKVNSFVNQTVWPFDCGATGGNQIVIAPNGDIGICHGFTAERLYFPTNVFQNNFDVNVDSVFREWSLRSPLNMDECQDCPALGICGGGCPFQAKIKHGSIWSLDDRFCVHAKTTLKWLIWDLFEKM